MSPSHQCPARRRFLVRFLFALVAVAAVGVPHASSLSAQDKPPLTIDDYGPWKRISSVALSPDGAWMSYVYDRLEGEDTLYVRSLDGGQTYPVPRGASPAFSADSRWIAYLVSPPEREGSGGGAAERSQTPPQRSGGGGGGGQARTLVLRNLASGDSVAFADVASVSFPDSADVLLIRKRGPGNDAEYDGADLVVYEPETRMSLNLGNVSEFAVNRPGTFLAYLVDAQDDAGNGIYLLDLSDHSILPVNTEQATYSQLSWNENGSRLAVLRGTVPEDKVQRDNDLLVLRNLDRPGSLQTLRSSSAGVPDGFVLSELSPLRWSEDGNRLFLGIKEQADEPEELENRANVDVWHWTDVEVQSVQEVRADRERNRTWSSVVNVDGNTLSFVRLADESLETVSQSGTSGWGIGQDPTPYEYEISWSGGNADYYRVDLDTGERTPLTENVGRTMGSSPDGTWWLFLRDENVIAKNLDSGREVNLTEASGVDFINRQDDHPYELPVYGVAGWSEDNKNVLLYDRFDVWAVPVDGSQATNLTAGVGDRDQVQFRVARLSSGGGGRGGARGGYGGGGGDEGIDLSKPILLTAYGEWTKKSGYFQVRKGGEPEPLIWLDKSVGRPTKASDANRMVFTEQTFVEFPDYWVSDTLFHNPRKVTEANPQQADFAWSPGRVLIDYTDSRGNKLQGTLALPAGYEEGKQYPMLVYFYELMSDQHHTYSMPTYDDRPHWSTYASNGYLVFQPDIVYTIGKPGTSAVDDLTSSVQKVIDLGYADPDHIGLQGHSWGGYQSSYVVTQTDMFAAVVTGAPPTNLISFYNTLYRSTGTVQQGITEVGQVRMGTTPFEDFDLFVSQSPIHHTQDITTPFLILHGTADGSVDYGQGLEYFNMARRLGKKVILLSYPDEGHHLSRKNNQIDFQIRMMEFFDHYLKGTQPAKWMVDGVPYLDKDYANPREMEDGTLWGKPPEEKSAAEGRRGGGGSR